MYINLLKAFILLLSIQISLPIFLPSGINQLNNLIYLQRLYCLNYQYNNNKCSLEEGAFCYFLEPSYIKLLNQENISLKKDYITKKWISLNNELNDFNYQEIYDTLENKIKKYYRKNFEQSDTEQKLPKQEFKIYITFEDYDPITIKKDIYLDRITHLSFLGKKIPLVIDGKIRLKYEKSKSVIVTNIADYPSKTYAIIESPRAVITLNGNNFKLVSFFVRPKNRYSEQNVKVTILGSISKSISIEGYNNNKLVFSSNHQFLYSDEKYWNQIIISNDLFINKLIIPGNFEIDNILLSVEENDAYDIESLLYSASNTKKIDLINDDDI